MSQVSTHTGPEPSRRRRWWGLAVLSGSLLVVVMDMTILNVALPEIAADLRPSTVELLWIVDAYAIVLAGLLVAASAIGDRHGHRRVLLGGFVVFGSASALVLLADAPVAVIAVRALLGVGGAMIMPSTLSMIRHLFVDPRERAFALGVWGAMAAVGAALGPILGGLMVELFGWHAAFLVNVPVMAVAIVAALLLLPETRSSRPAPWDGIAVVLSIVGMVAVVYAIKDVARHGPEVDGIVATVLAIVGLGGFVRRCLGRPDPVLELRLFARPSFTAGALTALSTMVAMAAVLLLGAQWLQSVEGLSPLMAGVALLPVALGGVVASPLAPVLAERIGARAVLAGGLACGASGFALLFLVEPSYPVFAVAVGLVGVGTGALAFGSAVIMASTPADQAGSAAAIEESSYEIGSALGVAVLGSLAATVYRAALPSTAELTAAGLPEEAATVARESLGGAEAVAGLLDPITAAAFLADARAAFTDSLSTAGLAGAIVMLAAAAVVWRITPRRLDVTGVGEHGIGG
ncbi:MAG: MFS transporter [Solirubrobacteraceae bacterium]|nr:MFS transporter [Solirubrobacteraceae bacterium]